MQQALDYLFEKNPIFQEIVSLYGLPTIPKRPQGFETLVLLILEQQVSIDSAKATFLKLKDQHNILKPETLVVVTDEQFRVFGVSRQKATYIKALSSAILNKEIDLESLPHKSSQQVREEMIKIKGIGNWTIDIYLMFCLQDPDLLPLGDIAVVNTIKELLNVHDKQEMQILTEQWSPYKSYATYLLWHYYLRKRNRTIVY
ncbi:DNA-3-methyladenine glycosylase family protein [Flavobacterium adhaerens]|uniref:DNA-3-methyladenine glycosylase family protein n=1 Tax=Flavobacterium adhaerens TaxID=3149043 RepID=UPI0032B480B8